jgi:WD40 repeat protein
MSSFRKVVVAFLLAASAAVIAGGLLAEETAPPAPPEAPNLTITQTNLGLWMIGAMVANDGIYSPDRRHVACSLPAEDGRYVMLDGVEGKHYQRIGVACFSPDSKHLACGAQSGDKHFIVVDGKEYKEYDGLGGVLFSPDSAHVAYSGMSVRSGEPWCIVADGVEGNWYPVVGRLVYSPDSKRLAYITGQKMGGMSLPHVPEGSGVIVVDGKEMRQFDSAGAVTFSPDSAHWACGIRVGNSSLVVMDGVDGRPYDWTSEPVFSPDSKHMAYIAASGRKSCVVQDGVEGKWYDKVGPKIGQWLVVSGDSSALIFSPDSQHFAYSAQDEEGFFVVQDGVEGKKHKGDVRPDHVRIISTPVFSPDSKHVAYSMSEADNTCVIVLDGVEQAAKYSGIKALTFSPDSSRLAYWANTPEGWCVVVDGAEGKKYRDCAFAGILTPKGTNGGITIAFTPDSKRVIYFVKIPGQYGFNLSMAVVDGVEHAECGEISGLTITSDSKHIAYRALGRNGEFWVLDGQEVALPNLKAITELVFDSPTKCHGIANGNTAFLIEIEIAP